MLFKKKRRRRIAEELKENLIAQDQLPSTSAVHLSCKKALFGKVEVCTFSRHFACFSSCHQQLHLHCFRQTLATFHSIICRLMFKSPYFAIFRLGFQFQLKIKQIDRLRNRIIFEKVCSRWRTELRASWRDVRSAEIPSAVVQLLVTRRPIDDSHVCGFLHKCGPYLEHIYMSVPHFHIAQHALYRFAHFPVLRDCYLASAKCAQICVLYLWLRTSIAWL